MSYRLLLLALLGVSLAYTLAARSIPMDPWTAAETINTQTLPTVYGALLSVVLGILLLRAPPPGDGVGAGRWLRVGGVCGAVAASAFALPMIGVWPALAVLLGFSAWWLGERRWPVLLATAFALPLAGFVGVELLLGVYLPD